MSSRNKILKQELVQKYGKNPQDTGNISVQIALLTERISYLAEHLKIHKKDFHTKRGLLLLISQRKKVINYLKRKDHNQYKDLIQSLGIRR